jgi:magnesium chelatase subunit D
LVAAALFAIDPVGLGGITLRAGPGPVRDRWLRELQSLFPVGTPMRRVPAQVSDDRLLGGLDLTATLRLGKPVAERGILVAADGGVLLLAMAERLPVMAAARIAAALDTHEVTLQREGLSATTSTHFGVVALDEGLSTDERPPAALLERLACHVDLTQLTMRDMAEALFTPADIAAARTQLASVSVHNEVIESLCATALALGIDSVRAPLLALRAARAAAALVGRSEVMVDDASLAGRLVFGSRATQLPATDAASQNDAQQAAADGRDEQPDNAQRDASSAPTPPPPPTPDAASTEQQPDARNESAMSLNDTVLAAAQAAIPEGLLAQLKATESAARTRTVGRVGAVRQSALRGRPVGVRPGLPRAGVRLNLLATLRAAAPWQTLRRASSAHDGDINNGSAMRVQVRSEDFHITRYKHRAQTTTIFMLDASGSSALHRLAEAKGAVELLLADCYVRRDQVAVLAFRDRQAEVLLPPTRSLVRAKRSLASLPGGGGTPLAAGIDAGMALAESIRRRGVTPTLVLLTDGRANVTRDGNAGREQAQQEALQAARKVRAAGIGALLIDTSPRPQALGKALAAELGARYLPLPYADATALARAVQGAAAHAA